MIWAPQHIRRGADKIFRCDRCRKFGGFQRQARYGEWGGPLRSAPLGNAPGGRERRLCWKGDTLKVPHVVTRFLAAEVCPATTRLRRPGRVGEGTCRSARSPSPGDQLGKRADRQEIGRAHV